MTKKAPNLGVFSDMLTFDCIAEQSLRFMSTEPV